MKLFLSPRQVQWYVKQGPWLCLAGLMLLVLAVRSFRDIGLVSGLMLFLFGGCTLGFRAWLRERGLWMLAVVALVAWVPLYAIMQWDAIRRELNVQNPRLVLLALDAAVASSIVWLQVRFLATVVQLNRSLSRVP